MQFSFSVSYNPLLAERLIQTLPALARYPVAVNIHGHGYAVVPELFLDIG